MTDLASQAIQILDHLNRNSGHKFRPVPANLRFLIARLSEGYSARRIKWVAAHKILEWGKDPKMQTYIRPKTLFNATNFAQYDGQTPEEPDDPEQTHLPEVPRPAGA